MSILREKSLGWLICCALLLGCHDASAPGTIPATPGNPEAKLIPVTLALNWFPEAEHGGFYAALEHGYFAEAGLNVTIQPGGPGAPVLQEVGIGRIEFGVDNADKLLLVATQGAELVAVMAPIQNSPRCIMVRDDSGITSFAELAKQPKFTLAMNAGHPFAKFLLHQYPLTNTQVVPYPGNLTSFLVEANYGQQAYNFSEPFVAEQKGVKPRCLMLADAGFNTYTSLLLTRRQLIAEKPELVRQMVLASQRGWKKYLEDPTATNARISQLNHDMGADILKFGVEALRPLCLPDELPADQFGQMTAERWRTLIQQMESCKSLEPGKVAAEKVFTAKFLSASEEVPPTK